jgi:hypothetical protein
MNEMLCSLRLEKHPDKTFIGRIERGFDLLGDHFTGASLTLAVGSLANFEAGQELRRRVASPSCIPPDASCRALLRMRVQISWIEKSPYPGAAQPAVSSDALRLSSRLGVLPSFFVSSFRPLPTLAQSSITHRRPFADSAGSEWRSH